MLVKGEIQTIDYNSNTCTVRMPVFESTNNGDLAITSAAFCNPPGIYNGYKVGDIVIVGFENNLIQNPIIIGKLYLGMAEESKEARGTINCTDFIADNTSNIPVNTNINSTANTDVQVAGNYSEYKTINDLINTIREQAQEIKTLKDRVTELEKK